MNSYSTTEMTQTEWLYDRQKGIGGSDVGTILGLNKWKSPYQLWLEKTGQVELDNKETEAIHWGNVLEEVVAKEFQERTGKRVRRRNQVFEHHEYTFLRANIDRDVVGENAILECKTANAFLGKEWEEEEIPQSYLCQVQHYMNVLDRDYAYIAVLIGGQKFIWKKVERDDDLIKVIQERLVSFWQDNVINGQEPQIDGLQATADFIKEQYKDEGTEEITLNSHFDDLIESRNQLKESEKSIKTQIRQIDNQIKNELGKHDAITGITPNHVISWKAQERISLDRKALNAKYPEISKDEEIYKTTTTRVLRERTIN